MHRTLGLSLIAFQACGCSSEATSPPVEETETGLPVDSTVPGDTRRDDSGLPGESGADGGVDGGVDGVADVAIDAPDLSKANPLEGIVAVKKVPGKTFSFTEGTTWSAGGFLLFSDIPAATIWKLTPPSTFTEFRTASGNANGLAWDPTGRLLACEHGNRRVSRSNADGTAVVSFVESYLGKKLNSPNDVIARSDGNVYFTDPDYGLSGRPAELAFKGVFRVDPGGTVSLIDDSMNEPNGIALSPDEKTLYVGDSNAPITNKWAIDAGGVPSGKTKFVSTGSDGMGMDDAGNTYLSSGSALHVFKPSGDAWGTIAVPEVPTNCAFGGPERKTLFISAGTSIYTVDLKVPGKG